jgi:5-(carboxyamino)imidazole ribonucleotide synthase
MGRYRYYCYMTGKQTIGIVGGGQLARMLTLAALPLGFRVVVLNPSPNSPAAQAGATEIIAGLYDSGALQQLAAQADFITIEIEHLDAATLQQIAELDKPVHPAPQTIQLIQDKYRQKEFLAAANIPIAPFAPVASYANALETWKRFNRKMIIKTRHGAYDGRGNMVVTSEASLKKALEQFAGKALYAEQIIPFKKELAVMVARNSTGEVRAYPVVETIHERNICLEVCAPADITKAEERRALAAALDVAKRLKGAGMFGVELFLTKDGEILVNEIAPRVHNSGHYTMDACQISQFEQHIRAVTGLPLGSTDLLTPAAVMINILGERDGPTNLRGLDEALAVPHTSVHLYGKSPTKIDRKMGHITATGGTLTQAKTRAQKARRKLDI